MTVHEILVGVARDFLWSQKCVVVLTEAKTGNGAEIPDAIGWRSRQSPRGVEWECLLVECKASRSDFAADREKRERIGKGMAGLRYYLTPSDLHVEGCEIPQAWGWLVLGPHNDLRVVKPATPVDGDAAEERALLISACRHLASAHQGVVTCRAYRVGNTGAATIGVDSQAVGLPVGVPT